MTFSQALEAVSRIYVPGVAGYYAQLPNDPWQQAHDDLEATIGLDLETREVSCHAFVSRCTALVAAFKTQNSRPIRPNNHDAFLAGNPDRVRQWKSQRDKTCFHCETKENLTLINDPEDIRKAKIVCRECKQGRMRA